MAREAMAPWMRRLKLRHLEVLLAIAESGSLTAAAQRLGASQPSVSQWLADVESALGVQLYRRGRQLAATPHLEPVLRHARRMVNDSRRLQSELAAIEAGRGGSVRLGTMHVAGPTLVPKAIVAFKAAHPQTALALVEDIAANLWPRFDRNELDILVTRLEARAHASGVQCEPLYGDPHCVIAGLHHPLLAKRRPTWRDAAPYPWILPPADTPLRRSIEATFVAENLAPPSAWLESAAITPNHEILQQTHCLGVVSSGLAQHLKKSRAAGIVALRLTSDMGPVGMVWRAQEPAPVVERMLAALRQAAEAMVSLRTR